LENPDIPIDHVAITVSPKIIAGGVGYKSAE